MDKTHTKIRDCVKQYEKQIFGYFLSFKYTPGPKPDLPRRLSDPTVMKENTKCKFVFRLRS